MPWPSLTADTAVLAKSARELMRTGLPVCELQQALVKLTEQGTSTTDAASLVIATIAQRIAGLPLEPGLARGWLIGMLQEEALVREQRRKQGAYYTPRGIALYMQRRALQLLLDEGSQPVPTSKRQSALRMLDPAVGSGAFLLAAEEAWRERGSAQQLELVGMDLDEGALQAARLAWDAATAASEADALRLEAANSLLTDPSHGAGQYDIVAGNPPYIDSERLVRQQPGLRKLLRESYRTARGNWDLSCVFVERALELVRPGGVVAMLVPRKLLAADYAAALHELLLEHELTEACDLAGLPVFEAGVQAVVLMVRKRDGVAHQLNKTQPAASILFRSAIAGVEADKYLEPGMLRALPAGYWCAAFEPNCEIVAQTLAAHPPLSEFAEIGDGCSTSEAYRLADLICDDRFAGGPRLVNTGLIKPYAILWGKRELTYFQQRYLHPRLDAARLEAEFPRRWRQSQSPKLLLPGLASELWAAADGGGGVCCGKGAVQVLPGLQAQAGPGEGLPLLAWLAWFNSAPVRWLYRALFGGKGFGAGSLHIGPRQLGKLPVPLAGLQSAASELAGLAEALAQEQQAYWADIAGKLGSVRFRFLVPARGNSPAEWRIDRIVHSAYGWQAAVWGDAHGDKCGETVDETGM